MALAAGVASGVLAGDFNELLSVNMINLLPLTGDVSPAVRALGWDWAIEEACQNYVAREAVQLPESEAEALLQAADTLYDMLVQAIPDALPD